MEKNANKKERICLFMSLHCSPESVTTLLTGYTPIQNKKLDKGRMCIYITLLTKASSHSYGFFPVVMYGCESWTVKKAEC